MLQSCFNEGKKVKYVQELLMTVCRKKELKLSHYSCIVKQLGKAQQCKCKRNLTFVFLTFRFIREHYFWVNDDTNSNIIPCVLLRIKTRTWSFQKETDPVWDILSVYALTCFLVHTYKRSNQRKQTKSSSKF